MICFERLSSILIPLQVCGFWGMFGAMQMKMQPFHIMQSACSMIFPSSANVADSLFSSINNLGIGPVGMTTFAQQQADRNRSFHFRSVDLGRWISLTRTGRLFVSLLILFQFSSLRLLCAEQIDGLSRFNGHVMDMSGQAIVGARVVISWAEAQNDPLLDTSVPAGDNVLGSATSNEDGVFSIQWSDIVPRFFEKQPYRTYLYVFHDDYVPMQQRITLDDSGSIEMAIKLRQGMRYSDKVIDESGKPVQGAIVRLEAMYRSVKDTLFVTHTDDSYVYFDQSNAPTARTDEKGLFEFKSVPPDGLILIRIQHPDHAVALRFRSTSGEAPDVPEVANNETPFRILWDDFDETITLRNGTKRTITVKDRASGHPIPDVEVCALFGGQVSTSDSNGTVHFLDNFPRGSFFVRLSKDRRWQNCIDVEFEGDKVLWIESPRMLQLSGTVRDKSTQKGIPKVAITSQFCVLDATDGQGRFSVSVPNAMTRISCKGPVDGWMVPFGRVSTDPNEIELLPKENENELRIDQTNFQKDLLFEFEQTPTTSFKVIDLDGKPAVNSKIAIAPIQTGTVHTRVLVTDSNGVASIELVPNAIYTLLAQGEDTGAAVSSFRSAAQMETRAIQLVPSIDIVIRIKQITPNIDELLAEKANVVVPFQKEQFDSLDDNANAFGRLSLELGRADAEGIVYCKFPKADLSIRSWNVYYGGRWYLQTSELDFGDDINREVSLVRTVTSTFGMK